MKNKVSVKIEKIILPLELKDKFDLVSYAEGRVILKWLHSEKEVLIECSLEQVSSDDSYGRNCFVISDGVHGLATLTFSSFGTNIDSSIVETDEELKTEISSFSKHEYTVLYYGKCQLEIDFI